MLDKRVMELADYWINVGINMQKGVAYPHKLQVNDYSWVEGRIQVTPQRLGNDEIITFNDLPDDDPSKAYLDGLKGEQEHLESEYVEASEVERRVSKAEEAAKKEKRDAALRELYAETELSQPDLASFDWVDLTQQSVQRIVSES